MPEKKEDTWSPIYVEGDVVAYVKLPLSMSALQGISSAWPAGSFGESGPLGPFEGVPATRKVGWLWPHKEEKCHGACFGPSPYAEHYENGFWGLYMGCSCGLWDGTPVAWPFEEEDATAADMERLGFEVTER